MNKEISWIYQWAVDDGEPIHGEATREKLEAEGFTAVRRHPRWPRLVLMEKVVFKEEKDFG